MGAYSLRHKQRYMVVLYALNQNNVLFVESALKDTMEQGHSVEQTLVVISSVINEAYRCNKGTKKSGDAEPWKKKMMNLFEALNLHFPSISIWHYHWRRSVFRFYTKCWKTCSLFVSPSYGCFRQLRYPVLFVTTLSSLCLPGKFDISCFVIHLPFQKLVVHTYWWFSSMPWSKGRGFLDEYSTMALYFTMVFNSQYVWFQRKKQQNVEYTIHNHLDSQKERNLHSEEARKKLIAACQSERSSRSQKNKSVKSINGMDIFISNKCRNEVSVCSIYLCVIGDRSIDPTQPEPDLKFVPLSKEEISEARKGQLDLLLDRTQVTSSLSIPDSTVYSLGWRWRQRCTRQQQRTVQTSTQSLARCAHKLTAVISTR